VERRFPLIENTVNPYRDTVIGKSNEPICVAGMLDRARQILGSRHDGARPDWTLEAVYDRLEANAPRIAIIGGSPDHPAHVMDFQTGARAALRIWENGGVPFGFSTPVMCDGTAQDHQGMSYSLQSRNAVAAMVISQIEGHSYHGAFVIQGCDKQPLGVVSALAHIDRLRRHRGEAPFFATFAPAHVLGGGSVPASVTERLHAIALRAVTAGAAEIAEDLRDAMSYILVCSTNTFYQGVLQRAQDRGVITAAEQKDIERALCTSTCDASGGVCAFNGTGNSSRHLVAGFGLVHPALELLTDPPVQDQINAAVDALARLINRPEAGVSSLIAGNVRNAIRIHCASGGSSNLMMHSVAAMLYGGYRFSLRDLQSIYAEHPIPNLFDHSLTQGRDIFALARQCCDGESRGMETLFNELLRHGVPMDLDATTVTGTTWRERLDADHRRDLLSANRVRVNPIILSEPKRPFSGIDILSGNFFETAVVKISGMSIEQLDEFDAKVALVVYFENENDANKHLLDPRFVGRLRDERAFPRAKLLAVLGHNDPDQLEALAPADYDTLFNAMVAAQSLKLVFVISGQGPVAFGMPEMYTPMQHINVNRQLKKLVSVITDGRYSGVTFGAAIGHMTPEAIRGGGILYLKTGDILHLGLRTKRIEFIDDGASGVGALHPANFATVRERRATLAEGRMRTLRVRQRLVAAANRLEGHTDAAHGVVPDAVYTEASLPWDTPRSNFSAPLEGAHQVANPVVGGVT
jgi:dihydroxy-acid dehydratase